MVERHAQQEPAARRLVGPRRHRDGAMWGLLGTLCVARGEFYEALWFMIAAVVVDAFDGILARLARVKETLPRFDGALLDNLLDYLNYVFVPALFLHEAGLLPGRWALASAVAVCLAAAYQFSQADAKTDDHFFVGFPPYWNMVAFYLFLAGFPPWVNQAIVALFLVLVFVPIRWLYPSRTPRLRTLTMAISTLWGLSCIGLLWQYPSPSPWLFTVSIATMTYYVVVSLVLGRDPRPRQPSVG